MSIILRLFDLVHELFEPLGPLFVLFLLGGDSLRQLLILFLLPLNEVADVGRFSLKLIAHHIMIGLPLVHKQLLLLDLLGEAHMVFLLLLNPGRELLGEALLLVY